MTVVEGPGLLTRGEMRIRKLGVAKRAHDNLDGCWKVFGGVVRKEIPMYRNLSLWNATLPWHSASHSCPLPRGQPHLRSALKI
jgi:hypothetical protein